MSIVIRDFQLVDGGPAAFLIVIQQRALISSLKPLSSCCKISINIAVDSVTGTTDTL
jgi:hypothetical protein